jgi:uncharacterized protein (DUF1800 family)
MFCNASGRSNSDLGRVRSLRILLFLFVFAGAAIRPMNAETPAVVIKATNPDGTNTGTARLGVAVNLSTSLVDLPISQRVWKLQGAGTLTTSGPSDNNNWAVYTPPSVMPANKTVTITASTTSPVVSATYTLTLGNPIPVVAGTSPNQAVEGGTVPITISGSAFVPGTVILVNGAAVSTTYQSANVVVAQVPGPAGSTANLSIKAKNPAPLGGTSAAMQLPVATLPLTATDPDGTNTGNARLGVPVNFTTGDTDAQFSTRRWTLQGAGTLQTSGTYLGSATYTPPQTMPANPTVTITVYLEHLPALKSSYTFTLVNPVPTVSSTSPAQLLTGGTQTVFLTGSGLLPGTVVAFNGTSLPTTYISYNEVKVSIPVANNATGTLSFQVQNPTPGGGPGTTVTKSVEPNSIALTATGVDGVNTGYADMDSTVAMSATVTGSLQTAVNWSLTDSVGSISSSGVYTPPGTLNPNAHHARIIATLASNPAITAYYWLDIINGVPTVTSASPDIVPAGATTTVTITGTGFVPTTVVEVNGAAVPTTYLSPTSIVGQISVGANATGNLSVQADTATQHGGLSDSFPVAISAPISETAAARLLDQTTFGPTTGLIQHVQQEGVTAWLSEQFNTPQTVLPLLPAVVPSYCGSIVGDPGSALPSVFCFESEWWQAAITGNDQLRQRVAFALSELFVISGVGFEWGQEEQNYANMLSADAFTNWSKIVGDVTINPAMGFYLNLLNSQKASGTLIANENYARENMQLFNLGLVLLNQDGSPQLDGSGNQIPAYTQAQVQAFARAFTGWTYANPDGSTPTVFPVAPNYYNLLVPIESWHDETAKTLLNGTTLPAGQSAAQDMANALANVFQHPNVPPFVSLQLIQHLVKSDPSPGYISRVAAVFTDNGNGVRGDMQAVLMAIFTDPEARAGDTAPQASDGHLREPILWMTGVMRGLGYVNVDPNDFWHNLSVDLQTLDEVPYESPAVFNFFPPSYVIPGTTLNAPEFGLENTATVTARLTWADRLVTNQMAGFNVDLSATSPLGQIAASQGPSALVQALNNLFLYGTMDSNTAAAITNEISAMSDPAQQVRVATYLVITSPPYLVLH